MAWNTVWPEGNKSVKANVTRGVNNMAYINVTMGGQAPIGTVAAGTPDHFWANNPYDKHHRFIQMPGFVDGAFAAADPALDAGMDGVVFNRQVNTDVGRWEAFYKNNQGTYQISPCYIQVTVNINKTAAQVDWNSVTDVPPNVYGYIHAIKDTGGSPRASTAYFESGNTTVTATTICGLSELTGTPVSALSFGNTTHVSGLTIKAAVRDGDQGNYTFYITYRAR